MNEKQKEEVLDMIRDCKEDIVSYLQNAEESMDTICEDLDYKLSALVKEIHDELFG